MADKKEADVAFGQRLRELRRRRGLSQQVLADRVGVSQTKLSDTENETVPAQFTPGQFIALAQELDVHPAELFGLPVPTGVEATGPAAQLLRYAANLTDDDIAALTSVAKQLASARAVTALPSREDLPVWGQLTPVEQHAYVHITDLVSRVHGLRAAEGTTPYQAGEPGARPDARRRRGGRGPGREAGA